MLIHVVSFEYLELGAASCWVTPFVYFILIFVLSVMFNPILSIFVALILGLVIHMLYDTYGLHASAAVSIAMFRYYFTGFILPRDGFDTSSSLTVQNVGLGKYLVYIGVLSVIYHLWFFSLEAFTFDMFFLRLTQAFVSSVVAVVVILFLHYVFVKFDRY